MRKWRMTLRMWVARAYQSLIFTSVEAFLALLSILAGVPIILDPASVAPDSIRSALPFVIVLGSALPFVIVLGWAIGMVAGGSLTLMGIVTSAIRLERAGVFLLANTTAVYGFTLTATFGFTAFIPIMTFLLFALAMVARFYVLGHVLRSILGLPLKVREIEGRTLTPVRVPGKGWVYLAQNQERES